MKKILLMMATGLILITTATSASAQSERLSRTNRKPNPTTDTATVEGDKKTTPITDQNRVNGDANKNQSNNRTSSSTNRSTPSSPGNKNGKDMNNTTAPDGK